MTDIPALWEQTGQFPLNQVEPGNPCEEDLPWVHPQTGQIYPSYTYYTFDAMES